MSVLYDSPEYSAPLILGFFSIKLPLEGHAFFLSGPIICPSLIPACSVSSAVSWLSAILLWNQALCSSVLTCALNLLVAGCLSASWKGLAAGWWLWQRELKMTAGSFLVPG